MRKLLLLWLLGAAFSGRAQVFRAGQLVLASGDTLRGEVEDYAWDEAPTELRFRAEGRPVTTYAAGQVRSFRFEGGQYFRRETVPLDRLARTRTNDLTEGLLLHQAPESLLLEVLVDGPGQLLYTTVADVPHYFVRRPGGPYLELAARNYLRRTPDGTLSVADGNNYRAQLQQVFGDCPAALQLLARAGFTMHELAAVVQAYNQHCDAARQAAPNYLSRPLSRRVALHLSVVAGGRYASAQLRTDEARGTEAPALQGVNLDGALHPVGGLTLDVLHAGRRFGLHVGALLTSLGRDASVPAAAPGYAGTMRGQQLLLECRLGGRVYWPLGSEGLRLLLGTGITLPVYLSSGNNHTLQYGASGTTARPATATTYVATSDYLPTSYPHGHFIGAFYTSLPYLEVGLRHNRLTLLLDGRLALPNDYYTAVSLRSETDGAPGYTYSYTPWYVGLSAGYGLFHQL